MQKIKNILFDLGGVLLNIDFNRMNADFKAIGFSHFERMYSQFQVDQLFEKLEKGLVPPGDFYRIMQTVGNENISQDQIRDAWNGLLVDFRKDSLDFLLKLKERYNVLLLSNTNAIHFEAFNQMLVKQSAVKSLDHFFQKTYYSHLLKMRKPDAEVFDHVLKDANLNAFETLFIDDTPSNIAAAGVAGFQTHLLISGEKIENLVQLAI